MKSIEREVAEAIQAGLVSGGFTGVYLFDRPDEIRVAVDGSLEPIRVTREPLDVIVPPFLEEVRAGVQLDVMAVVASRS